jgi:Sigma-70 region 2
VSRTHQHATTTRTSAACPGFITELLLRCGQGDEAAFGRLFDLFHAPVAAAALRQSGRPETVEELVHEVFVRVWRHAPTFAPGAQGPVGWVMDHVQAVTQSLMVTSPAVTTAGRPRSSTVMVAVQAPVSGNR